MTVLGPALAQELAGVQLAPGAGGLVPPAGQMGAEWGTPAPPAAAVGVTVIAIVEVPPIAIVPPAKLQVMSEETLLQVQLVPLPDTKVKFAGSWSCTSAVVAAATPELVTVRV